MTVAALPAIATYNENGVTTAFAAPFRFDASRNLRVDRLYPDGAIEILRLGSDYSVAGGTTDAGGTVTTVYAGSTGTRIRIRRVTPRTQPMDYTTGDRFPAESHEAALDRGTMIDQEQDASITDIGARALRVPEGETVRSIPQLADRVNRLLGFDGAGMPIMVPGSAAQLGADLTSVFARLLALEIGLSLAPFGGTADWAAFPALQRALAAAHLNPGAVTIKFVGVGDSNGNGAGVSPENIPVRVAMTEARKVLDPRGVANWVAENRSVDGTIVASYFQGSETDPTSPAQYVEAADATVVVVAYSANDPALESYNAALGLDGIYSTYGALLKHVNAQNADALLMTSPHGHVARIRAPDAYGLSGLTLNPTIPMSYPRGGTFRVGRTDNPVLQISFIFTPANRRVTVVDRPGLFTSAGNGFGLSVGKRIEVRLPSGLADPANGGVYTVAAIDTAGNWIQLDHEWLADANLQWVDQGQAVLTAGTYAANIQRIDIDPLTELTPSVTDGWFDYDYAGTGSTVPVLTRYLEVNDARRRAVRNHDGHASVVDMEAQWLMLVDRYGEDRYYTGLERVHWNDFTVTDRGGMRDTFARFFHSLGAADVPIAANRPLSQPDLVVRPALDTLVTTQRVNKQSSVDLQVATGEAVLLRNSRGLVHWSVTDGSEPKRYNRHFDPDYTVAFEPYRQDRSYTTTQAYEDIAIPADSRFTIDIDCFRSGIGRTNWRVEGMNVAGTVTFTATKLHETGSPNTITLSAAGGSVRMTLFSPTAQTSINAYLWIRPEAPVAI